MIKQGTIVRPNGAQHGYFHDAIRGLRKQEKARHFYNDSFTCGLG